MKTARTTVGGQTLATNPLQQDLTLTPFEWSMLDQVTGAPMTMVATLRISGSPDRQAFESAVRETWLLEPLLRSRVSVGQTHNDCHWVFDPTALPDVRWHPTANNPGQSGPTAIRRQGIDLQTETGFRLYAYESPGGYEFQFYFHHACCDGQSVITFIQNVLCRYHNLSDPSVPIDVVKPKIADLTWRNPTPPKRLSLPGRILRGGLIIPRRIIGAALDRPLTLGGEWSADKPNQTSVTDDPLRLYQSHAVSLSQSDKERIAQAANVAKARLNQLLMRDLVRAIAEFHSDTSQPLKQTTRFLIPISLRNDQHQHMPAANCVSLAFFNVDRKQVRDKDQLLRSLSQQMKYVRKWQIEYSWSQSIAILSRHRPLFGLLKRMTGKRLATTTFSNLGNALNQNGLPKMEGKTVASDIIVESIHLAAPCDASCTATFAANFYAGRLTLDMNFIPERITPAAAHNLLALWREKLLESAKSG